MDQEIQTRARRETVAFEPKAGSVGQIAGYAAVFNEETVIHAAGGTAWRERIGPSAFDDVLAGNGDGDTIAAFNHHGQSLLGRTSSGTLRLKRDAVGLHYAVDLPDTSVGRDVQALVQRGDLKGSSFKFAVAEGGFSVIERAKHPGDLPLLQINRIKRLMDVGPVVDAAYDGTTVSARSVPDVLAGAMQPDDIQQAADVEARESMRAALEQAKAWRTA